MAKKKIIIVGLGLLLFGAARLPFDRSLDAWRLQLGFGSLVSAQETFRERVSQNALIAVLGGLRSVVAVFLDLGARESWAKSNYGEVEQAYRFIQRLQPEVFYYWDIGQWMLASNAAAYYFYEDEDRSAVNSLLCESYAQKGVDMLIEGARYLPHDYRIHQALAQLLVLRYHQPNYRLVAEAWAKVKQCPDAPPYAPRFYAYALAHLPEREDEAREEIERLYAASPKNHVPTLLNMRTIFQARQALKEPSADRAEIFKKLQNIWQTSPPCRLPALRQTLQQLETELKIPREKATDHLWDPPKSGIRI